jgi:hypothetical protein
MASKRTLGFSSTVFRKKFRAGMTVRIYRDNEVVFFANPYEEKTRTKTDTRCSLSNLWRCSRGKM